MRLVIYLLIKLLQWRTALAFETGIKSICAKDVVKCELGEGIECILIQNIKQYNSYIIPIKH